MPNHSRCRGLRNFRRKMLLVIAHCQWLTDQKKREQRRLLSQMGTGYKPPTSPPPHSGKSPNRRNQSLATIVGGSQIKFITLNTGQDVNH
jgi:hypothetical protein